MTLGSEVDWDQNVYDVEDILGFEEDIFLSKSCREIFGFFVAQVCLIALLRVSDLEYVH